MEFDREKIIQKWAAVLSGSSIISSSFDGMIVDTGSTEETSAFDWSKPLLPIAMRIQATTIGSGGWIKSKKQQLKESRINKLRKIKGKKPNVVLPKDEFVHGLVSVQPLSMPTGKLFHMDFKYGKSIKQQRKEKLIRILRKEKMEYIDQLVQKIIQENG